MKRTTTAIALVVAAVLIVGAYLAGARSAARYAAFADASEIAAARGLQPAEVASAVRSFVPPGKADEYIMFSSGGHGGQVLVIGLPSMRLLKVIGTFATEPWQGFGYGADWGERVLDEGTANGEATGRATPRLT